MFLFILVAERADSPGKESVLEADGTQWRNLGTRSPRWVVVSASCIFSRTSAPAARRRGGQRLCGRNGGNLNVSADMVSQVNPEKAVPELLMFQPWPHACPPDSSLVYNLQTAFS